MTDDDFYDDPLADTIFRMITPHEYPEGANCWGAAKDIARWHEAALRDAYARIAELEAERDHAHERLLRTDAKLVEILATLEELRPMTDLLDRLAANKIYHQKEGWITDPICAEAATALRDAHARIAELEAERSPDAIHAAYEEGFENGTMAATCAVWAD